MQHRAGGVDRSLSGHQETARASKQLALFAASQLIDCQGRDVELSTELADGRFGDHTYDDDLRRKRLIHWALGPIRD